MFGVCNVYFKGIAESSEMSSELEKLLEDTN